MNSYDMMENNSVKLPKPTQPKGNYNMITSFGGKYIYTAGTGCSKDGKPLYVGLLGGNITIEEGKIAAEQCAKNLLANVEQNIGSLNKISRLIKMTVFIAATSDFKQQSMVGDGASDFFRKVFGLNNVGVRSAIGVSSLPNGQVVEIEAIFELK